MKVSTLFCLSLVAFNFIACSKGSTSTVAAAAVTYYTSNGLCYNNSNTQVDYSYCSSSTVYHTTNGLCYNSSNIQVDYSLCSSSTSGYYISGLNCYNSSNVQVAYNYCTGSTGSTCSGLYYYVDYYGALWKVTCDGVAGTGNCSGYNLIQSSTGNYAYCN